MTVADPTSAAPSGTPRPSWWAIAVVTLFSLQPFVSFLATNQAQIRDTGRVVAYGVVTALLALAVLFLLRRRDETRTATSIAVVVLAFFSFGSLFNPDPATTAEQLVELTLWLVVVGVVIRLVFKLASWDSFRTAVLLFGVTMLLIPAVTYATGGRSDRDQAPDTDPVDLAVPFGRPNVYWFVLDAYARQDQLLEDTGFDNAEFLAGLEERGFSVSRSSRSSYTRTHLSVSSTVDMAYTSLPGNTIDDEFEALTPIVLGDNATVRQFRSLGYTYAYAPAGALEWSGCRPDLADVCLPVRRPAFAVGELERTLLRLTPLGTVSLPTTYTDAAWVVDAVGERRGDELEEPFFLFSHILGTHWPYRYRADCTARDRPRDYRSLTGPEHVTEYVNQVKCTNPLVLEGVDQILADDPTAIIVIQSDHGASFSGAAWDLPFDQWDRDTLNERFSVFNAMRLPETCDQDIEGQPLVNTFRIVFACIGGRPAELLDYRAFVAPLEDIRQTEEIDPDRFDAAAGDGQ